MFSLQHTITVSIQISEVTYSANLVVFMTEDRLELDRLDTNTDEIHIVVADMIWIEKIKFLFSISSSCLKLNPSFIMP